jgi:hypothetical protein
MSIAELLLGSRPPEYDTIMLSRHVKRQSSSDVARRHIAEQQRLQQYRCESLKSRIICLDIYTR